MLATLAPPNNPQSHTRTCAKRNASACVALESTHQPRQALRKKVSFMNADDLPSFYHSSGGITPICVLWPLWRELFHNRRTAAVSSTGLPTTAPYHSHWYVRPAPGAASTKAVLVARTRSPASCK